MIRTGEPRDAVEEVVTAVLYALRAGCFFPVPQPKPGASVQAWIQWGALRHLHAAIAALPEAAQNARKPLAPRKTRPAA